MIVLHGETIGDVPALIGLPSRMPAPAVVWVHGFGADALANAAELQRLAVEGFIAVGVDAAGHGRRRLPDLEARVAAPREEALRTVHELAAATAAELPELVRALARWPEVLERRVGLVGVSMGGYAVYRALTLGATPWAAVALLADPEWPGDHPGARVARLTRVPLLSITAERDESVPPGGARRLHEAIAARIPRSQDFRHVELPGAPHLMSPDDWRRAMDETVGWLKRHLLGTRDAGRGARTP